MITSKEVATIYYICFQSIYIKSLLRRTFNYLRYLQLIYVDF